VQLKWINIYIALSTVVLMLANEIIFFVKLKCQTRTVILSVVIKYSMCDLICNVSYAHKPQRCNMRQIR